MRRTPRTRVLGQGPNLATRIAIQAQSEWARIRSNRSAIRLNCSRIAQNSESSRNRPDCKYRGLDCGRIATTGKSSFRGLRGTERIAEGPRATVWACPPVWAQTWRTAVRLGLISDCTEIAQFSTDCVWIGRSCQDCIDPTAIAFIPQSARLRGDCPVFGNPTAIGIGRLRID